MKIIKKALKVASKAAGGMLLKRKIPLNVMISLTDRCQSRCAYCQIPRRRKEEMTTAQVFSLLDQITAQGCERVALWGGEPLLREDIGKIIRYAKKKGLYVTMDTNGYLVKEHLDDIAALDVLLISWDGPAEAHNANRMPDSYPRVMEAIRIARGKVKLWTLTVLTTNNIGCLPQILEMGRQQGVPMVFQLLYHNEGQAGNTSRLLPDYRQHIEAVKQLLEAKKKGYPVVNSSGFLNSLLKWKDFSIQTQASRQQGYPVCRAGQFFCNVDVDGRVYPCNRLVGAVEAKSFLETGFREAFDFSNRQGCVSCITPGLEFSLMFSFDFASVLNWAKFVFKR